MCMATVRCKKTFPTGSRVVRHGSLSPKIFAKVGPVHELLKFTNVREPSREVLLHYFGAITQQVAMEAESNGS